MTSSLKTPVEAKNPVEDRNVRRPDSAHRSIYHTLLYTIFQKPRDCDSGMVVAVSSINPGEGVTYVTKALVHELAKYELSSVAGINSRFLRKLHEPTMEALRKSLSGVAPRSKFNAAGLEAMDASLMPVDETGPWEGSWQYRRDCINLLRSEYDYTLIDCPSLKDSGELLSVAPFVDGVILVIEANRTRREQLRHTAQSIAEVQGVLLGYVLNKRTYQVPGWMYHKM
jgi:hypothetical protein